MVAFPRPSRRDWMSHPTVRKALLACGVASSVLYIAADLIGTVRYPGYSWFDQEFSELTAQGAPTRDLMIALVEFPYNLLVLAFAAALWTSAEPKKRAGRIAAAMMVGYTAFGFIAGTITPMATREAMAVGDDTLRNALHGPLTVLSDVFLVVGMYFAAPLLGKRFRYYSYATIITLLTAGITTGLQIPQMEANDPTPWMGVEERVNIYATMLWFAVLAAGLLRVEVPAVSGRTTSRHRPPSTA